MNKISHTILANNDKLAYDEAVKRFLSFKGMIAYILKNTVKEFRNFTIEEIMSCIEDVGVSNRNVDMDEIISGMNTENVTISEGIRKFDILFSVTIKLEDIYEKIIVNIEAQNTMTTYNLLKRAEYYVSRIISSQYGREFVKSDYDDIKKVISIWLCTNEQTQKGHMDIYKNYHEYNHLMSHLYNDAEDFYTIIMVNIGESDNAFINTMNLLFSDEDASKKIEALKKEIGDILEDKEVRDMCNFSEVVYARGMNKGIEKGKEEEKVKNLKSVMVKLGISLDEAMKLLDFQEIEYPIYKEKLGC